MKVKTRKNDNVKDKGICVYCDEYIQRYPTPFQCDRCYLGLCKRCYDQYESELRQIKKNVELCPDGRAQCEFYQVEEIPLSVPVVDKVKTYTEHKWCPCIRDTCHKLQKKFKIDNIIMIARSYDWVMCLQCVEELASKRQYIGMNKAVRIRC